MHTEWSRVQEQTRVDEGHYSIPKVSYTQVSRWESRGLDPSTGKITTLVYLAALQRLRGR